MQTVQLRVNGAGRSDQVEARLLLVHYLRSVCWVTGTQVGCDTSQCGACTVLLDGAPVKSCNMLALQAEGGELTTIEGLAPKGGLHPLQAAFREHHALQCGYCTPGFIMAAVALLAEHPDPSEEELGRGLEGSLCRCTGYLNVRRAVTSAGRALQKGDPAPRTGYGPETRP